MKKLFSLLLVLTMLLSLAGIAQAEEPIEEPIKVTVWHTRGSGANGEMIAASVKEFNETIGAEKGIVVEEVYQGGYVDCKSKIMNAIATGDQNEIPEVVVLERAAGVPDFAIDGRLVDLTPYVEASGLDMDNFQQVLLGFSYYEDQLISLPYIRSTPVMYYNKTMADAKGLTAPTTIDELIAFGKALTVVDDSINTTTTYGFYMPNDPAWFIANMVWQMDSALFSDDGTQVPCLSDGTLLKALTAWREWVDEGWCMIPPASGSISDMFLQGQIASIFESTGSMANIINNAEFEVGVCFLPTWGTPSAPTGGGNIALLKDNPQESIDAAWEFLNFLMSDEQVALNSVNTGYLPTTKTSVETDIIKSHWEAHPQFRVAFDQLSIGRELPWCSFKAAFEDQMRIICGDLIQSRTITAEEAVQKLQEALDMIYLEQGM